MSDTRKDYTQGFKDALQFVSKYVYLNKGTKSLQNDIVELCHWLDANPQVGDTELKKKLLLVLERFVKYVRM